MGIKKVLLGLAIPRLIISSSLLLMNPSAKATSSSSWIPNFRKKLKALEKKYPGQFGVFVKKIETGETISWRSDESWYIASGVKLPIALETLRQVDAGKLTLKTKVTLSQNDFVDGAGPTNFFRPGKKLTVHYLLEQMMIHSDNTASDLLIRTVGLGNVNKLLRTHRIKGFSPITSLADVRREAFQRIHPQAKKLKGQDLLYIKAGVTEKEKARRIREICEAPAPDDSSDWKEAFTYYYSRNLNSATLSGYGSLIESMLEGKILTPESLELLIGIMARAETGKNRIKAGLPVDLTFAHKTGTQYQRVCDFGVIWNPATFNPSPLIIAACTRGFKTTAQAESALKTIGRALWTSGAIDGKTKLVVR